VYSPFFPFFTFSSRTPTAFADETSTEQRTCGGSSALQKAHFLNAVGVPPSPLSCPFFFPRFPCTDFHVGLRARVPNMVEQIRASHSRRGSTPLPTSSFFLSLPPPSFFLFLRFLGSFPQRETRESKELQLKWLQDRSRCSAIGKDFPFPPFFFLFQSRIG